VLNVVEGECAKGRAARLIQVARRDSREVYHSVTHNIFLLTVIFLVFVTCCIGCEHKDAQVRSRHS
jgi:hypothetical protein